METEREKGFKDGYEFALRMVEYNAEHLDDHLGDVRTGVDFMLSSIRRDYDVMQILSNEDWLFEDDDEDEDEDENEDKIKLKGYCERLKKLYSK